MKTYFFTIRPTNNPDFGYTADIWAEPGAASPPEAWGDDDIWTTSPASTEAIARRYITHTLRGKAEKRGGL